MLSRRARRRCNRQVFVTVGKGVGGKRLNRSQANAQATSNM